MKLLIRTSPILPYQSQEDFFMKIIANTGKFTKKRTEVYQFLLNAVDDILTGMHHYRDVMRLK